jgi:hypothetical protein
VYSGKLILASIRSIATCFSLFFGLLILRTVVIFLFPASPTDFFSIIHSNYYSHAALPPILLWLNTLAIFIDVDVIQELTEAQRNLTIDEINMHENVGHAVV